MEEKYITNRNIHFGNLKRTLSKDTIITLIEEENKKFLIINGQKVQDFIDFNICLKHNFIVKYNEQKIVEKKQMKKENKEYEKMPVYHSDEDEMKQIIDISYTKNEKKKEQIKKEENKNYKQIRGMKVIRDQEKTIEQEGIKIKLDTKKTTDSDKQMIKMINGEDTKITKIENADKKKKDAQKMAKVRAAKRKKQSEENVKKLAEENNKK